MENSQVLSPEDFTWEVAKALPLSTPVEAERLIEHARSWATVFYNGVIPSPLVLHLKALEAACH